MKANFDLGTILRVKPNLSPSGKTIEPTTKFVVVVSVTRAGTPKVAPLKGDLHPILPAENSSSQTKNMHWSNSGWRVYGHDTEIYIE